MLAGANPHSGEKHSLRPHIDSRSRVHYARAYQPNSIVTKTTDKNARNGLEQTKHGDGVEW